MFRAICLALKEKYLLTGQPVPYAVIESDSRLRDFNMRPTTIERTMRAMAERGMIVRAGYGRYIPKYNAMKFREQLRTVTLEEFV